VFLVSFFFVILGMCVAIVSYYTGIGLSIELKAFSTLGIVSLLFLAGLEGSLRFFVKGLKAGGLIALGGVFGALASGFILMFLLNLGFVESFAIGVILSATSVSVTVSTLEEMDKLDTREAMLIVEAAVVDDVIVLVLLNFLNIFSMEMNLIWIVLTPLIAFMIWYGTA